jgi:hypothetical protein
MTKRNPDHVHNAEGRRLPWLEERFVNWGVVGRRCAEAMLRHDQE